MKYKIAKIIIRTCRICGCTQYHACPGGCYWVEPDLCSRCAEKLDRQKQFTNSHIVIPENEYKSLTKALQNNASRQNINPIEITEEIK